MGSLVFDLDPSVDLKPGVMGLETAGTHESDHDESVPRDVRIHAKDHLVRDFTSLARLRYLTQKLAPISERMRATSAPIAMPAVAPVESSGVGRGVG